MNNIDLESMKARYSHSFLFRSAISFHEAQETAVRGFSRRNTNGGKYDGQRIGWQATKFMLENLFWKGPR